MLVLLGLLWRTLQLQRERNAFKTEQDFAVSVRGVEHLRELGHQNAFREISSGEAIAGAKVTRADLTDFARNRTAPSIIR